MEAAEPWDTIVEVLRCNWFTRRWIVQEIALAKEAVVHCGNDSLPWMDFCHAVELFQLYHDEIKEGFLMPQYDYFMNHLGEIEGLGACRLVQITNNLFRKARDGSIQRRLVTLESLVSDLTMFNAGQEHDLIYALIAIAKDIRTEAQKLQSIDPDASPVQVPTTLADKNIPQLSIDPPAMGTSNEGHELEPVGKRRRLPKVVIDPPASGPRNELHEPEPTKKKTTLKTSVDKVLLTVPVTRKRRTMQQVVKDAQSVQPIPFPVDYGQPFLKVCIDFVAFAIMRSKSLDVIFRPWMPAELKRKHTLPSWLVSVDQHPFESMETGSLKRVNADPLVGLNAMEPKRYCACGQNAPTRRIGWEEGVERPHDGWGFCCIDRESAFSVHRDEAKAAHDHRSLFVTGIVLDAIGELQDPATGGTVPAEWFEFGDWGWEQRANPPPDHLWRTMIADRDSDGKYVGVYYRKTIHNIVRDTCGTNGDLAASELLQTPRFDKHSTKVLRRIFAVTTKRRLFKTTEKCERTLGLAPRKAQVGDELCILFGCSVPVVLRRHQQIVDGEECT